MSGALPPHAAACGRRIAVVIPVYNHASRVAGVVRRAMALGYPVFVVDDGSTDGTARVLETLAGVRRLRHRRNRGKGAALLTGMHAVGAAADLVITLDADGQHDPADAARLLAALPDDGPAIVVGRRAMDHAPWTSRKGRAFSNFWVRLAGGPRIADSQSGFRIYPLPETLALGAAARRYQFEVEVLVRAAWRGLAVVEAPISAAYGTDLPRISHFHPFIDFLRNFGAFSRLITRRVFTRDLWPAPLRRRGVR